MSKSLNQFSSGEKKKFFLAAAFAGKGDVLLLDEPSNHLDRQSREYLSFLIESYPGTLIVCSHDEKLFCGWQQVIQMKQEEAYE